MRAYTTFLTALLAFGLMACGQDKDTREHPADSNSGATLGERECEYGRSVRIAGMTWESNLFLAHLYASIIKTGYGCDVEILTGETVVMVASLARGSLDLVPEIYADNAVEAWNKAARLGDVVELGKTFDGSQEGWYVPAYMVTGDDALPIRSVTDLAAHAQNFVTEQTMNKPRFYNCPVGWQCEIVNSQKFKAYGLDNYFEDFKPGTGAALEAAIKSAYIKRDPILAYYWEPTSLLGKLDMRKLDEPPFNAADFATLKDPDNSSPVGVAYPLSRVVKGSTTSFVEGAPTIADFLRKAQLSNQLLNTWLSKIAEEDLEYDQAAEMFLHQQQEWHNWVDSYADKLIRASL